MRPFTRQLDVMRCVILLRDTMRIRNNCIMFYINFYFAVKMEHYNANGNRLASYNKGIYELLKNMILSVLMHDLYNNPKNLFKWLFL